MVFSIQEENNIPAERSDMSSLLWEVSLSAERSEVLGGFKWAPVDVSSFGIVTA